MKYTRLYTGPDQQSHFEEAYFELSQAEVGLISNSIDVTTLLFGLIEDETEIPWHNPPQPQYVIMLKGAIEVEISDGTKRVFKEGDILLAEDVTGKGHITRAASQGKRKYLVLPVKA